MGRAVYTIGHSTHDEHAFIGLLQRHAITAVADVRSEPYSRHVPHFSKAPLKSILQGAGIAYVFLGQELGARTDDERCFDRERVVFDRLAHTSRFLDGLSRIRQGAESHRIALLCAEAEPLHCHRAVLVSRHLRDVGLDVSHILSDGTLEPHATLERRMLTECRLDEGDLFEPYESQLERAYENWGERIAWRRPPPGESGAA